MEENDKFNALKYLSETHRSLHNKRQQYEWKVIFAVITFFVTTVGAFYSRKVFLPEAGLIKVIVWIVYLSFGFVTVGFLRSIHTANGRNKSFAESVEKQIIQLVNNKTVSDVSFSMGGFRKTYWAFYWQASLIILLAIVAAAMLTFSKPMALNDKTSANDALIPNHRIQSDAATPHR